MKIKYSQKGTLVWPLWFIWMSAEFLWIYNLAEKNMPQEHFFLGLKCMFEAFKKQVYFIVDQYYY